MREVHQQQNQHFVTPQWFLNGGCDHAEINVTSLRSSISAVVSVPLSTADQSADMGCGSVNHDGKN